MGEYVSYSNGPGSIAALKPLAALSHAPTISSNDPRGAMAIANEHVLGRNIKVKAGWTKGFADPHQPLIKTTHRAMPIRRIGESECAMGDGEESSQNTSMRFASPRFDMIVGIGAVVLGVLYIAYRVMQEDQHEQGVRDSVEKWRSRYVVQRGSTSQGPYR